MLNLVYIKSSVSFFILNKANELKLFKDKFYFAIQDPTVKLDDLKILHKRLGRNLYDIGYDNGFDAGMGELHGTIEDLDLEDYFM